MVLLADLYATYPQRQLENSLIPGWPANTGSIPQPQLRFVSAANLSSVIAPPLLTKVTALSPQDRDIWLQAYNEEYDGLQGLTTYNIIGETEYQDYKRRVTQPFPP